MVIEEVDPVNPDSEALPGKMAEPQEIDGVTQPEDLNDNCQYPSKR